MQRVLVIGSPGAGKSTFARQLAGATGLPLVHLDQAYWSPGWVEPEKDDWAKTVERLIAEPAWVMDGNYGNTLARRLERADTVVMLDLPRWRCLLRVFTRILRHYGRTRADMTPGCPEHFSWKFLIYVWRFPRDKVPERRRTLQAFDGDVVTLASPSAVSRFLSGFAQRKAAA